MSIFTHFSIFIHIVLDIRLLFQRKKSIISQMFQSPTIPRFFSAQKNSLLFSKKRHDALAYARCFQDLISLTVIIILFLVCREKNLIFPMQSKLHKKI